MTTLQLELPADLREEVARVTTDLGVSEAAWLEEAIREKLTAIAQLKYIRSRAARGNRETYDKILDGVPAAPPVPGDEW